jgi:hypothetical protein
MIYIEKSRPPSTTRVKPRDFSNPKLLTEIINNFDNLKDSFDWISAPGKAVTYTGQQNKKEKTNIQAVSGILTHVLSVQALKAYASDHAATGTGASTTLNTKIQTLLSFAQFLSP